MTEINKEKLMLEILEYLKSRSKDYESTITNRDLANIELGELHAIDALFYTVAVKGIHTTESGEISDLFRKESEESRQQISNKFQELPL